MERGKLPEEVWKDGGKMGVQTRGKRRKGKEEQERGEIKRTREA